MATLTPGRTSCVSGPPRYHDTPACGGLGGIGGGKEKHLNTETKNEIIKALIISTSHERVIPFTQLSTVYSYVNVCHQKLWYVQLKNKSNSLKKE